ncbi:MAG: gamma-glutamyltransferase [Candidatus Acidiferrales bacterium]
MRFLRKSAVGVALLAAAVAFSAAAQMEQSPAGGAPATARGEHGMVAADEPLAAEAGLEILRKGGNAVDAAVAVAFALAVTHPQAGNLGGGGFLLVRLANGTTMMVDFRETAPAAARWDMYLDAQGKLIPGSSTNGWRSSAVPGSVAGLELALRTYGTLSLKEVMVPAIRLAKKGFPVDEELAESFRSSAERLRRDAESRRLFFRHERPLEAGDLLVQRELAATLEGIARKGSGEFYRGSIARRLVKESRRAGGLLLEGDLRNYRAVLREPLRGTFNGYEIISAAPPSSGGVALLETLNMLERLLGREDKPESPETIHLVTESLRRAFADRARYLADPDFAVIPVVGLISKDYAAAFAVTINRERASASAALERPDPLRFDMGTPARTLTPPRAGQGARREGENTTHVSVMDAAGNAVALTTTINNSFGNGITVPGLGFLLNNEMDDFTVEPGAPNTLFGLMQSDANKIDSGKRPLSAMTPTLVVRNGRTILALGSPGGPRIISAVVEVLLNRLYFDDDLALAVARPRFHHQWLPDALYVEEGVFGASQLQALEVRGHTVRKITELNAGEPEEVGQVNAVERHPATGELYGVADARRRGAARGY